MKKILIPVSCAAVSILSFFIGYVFAKKRYSPKAISGYLFVDYSEDEKHPSIYINELDPTIFKKSPEYIVTKVKHIR